MNNYLFYGSSDSTAGDSEYDHIVTVRRIQSDYDDDLYHEQDVITISDHGLWAPSSQNSPQYYFRQGRSYHSLQSPPLISIYFYYFSYVAKDFVGTRKEANSKTGALYTLPQTKSTTVGNYGIAHTGIFDEHSECLPLRVETDLNSESPQIGIKSDTRPSPMAIQLTVTVSGLQDGVQYLLLKYKDEAAVPSSNFAAHLEKAAKSISFSKTGGLDYFVFTETIMSDEKAIYRAVRK